MSKMDKNLKNDEFDHDGKLTNLGLRRYREAVKITIGYFKENGNLVPDLMSTRQAASYLDKSQKTLEAWRRKQIGPKFYSDPHTGAVYYTRHDIREHLKLPSTHSKVAEAQEAV